MRAVAFSAFGTPPELRNDLATPDPAAGEVLVRVQTPSANPVDNAIAGGMLEGMFDHEFPVVLGRDFAGVIEATGSSVTRYGVGDEVYGFLMHADPAVGHGSWAEHIAVSEEGLMTRRPQGVEASVAGAVPLSALTAMAALDALELTSGNSLLIVGATGGVGSIAVQLAAAAGVAVIAPALPEDEAYLRRLGVSDVLDRGADVAAAVREIRPDGVDGLIDLVSYTPDALEAHAAALVAGGRASTPNHAAGDGSDRINVMAAATPENFECLTGLLEAGELEVPIQATYPLERAGEALGALAGEHIQGKLAISVE